MKYYEFNDAEYYALIRANTEQQAIDHYFEVVTSEVDDDELHPDILTRAEAKKRFFDAIKREPHEDALYGIRQWKSRCVPLLLLISAELC